ncbi:MAG: hypothetical protein AAB473_03400 [Patescibacteria group bacterium]
MSSVRTAALLVAISALTFALSGALTLCVKSTITIWWPIGWTIFYVVLTVAARRRKDLWQNFSMKAGCAALISMSLGMLAALLWP